jgi:hypothetical protein
MGKIEIFGMRRMESFSTLWVIFPSTFLDWALFGDEEIEDIHGRLRVVGSL